MSVDMTSDTKKFLQKLLINCSEDGKIVQELCRQFYEKIPDYILQGESEDLLKNLVVNFADFIEKRQKNEIKLVVKELDAESSLIFLVYDDIPFMLDSITEELGRQHINIYRYYNPIVMSNRDDLGNLKEICGLPSNINGSAECMICLQVSSISVSDINKLESDLRFVIANVIESVNDWQYMRAKLLESINWIEKGSYNNNIDQPQEFLKWLANDNFIFLGYSDYDVNGSSIEDIKENIDNRLGIFKTLSSNIEKVIIEDRKNKAKNKKSNLVILFDKLNQISPVHRGINLDSILLQHFNKDGEVISKRRFIGMYTTGVEYQSVNIIPLIKDKIKSILEKSGFPAASHGRKEIVSILEPFPRDLLFKMPTNELLDISLNILALQNHPSVKIFNHSDSGSIFLNLVVVLPKERLDARLRNKVNRLIAKNLDAEIQYSKIDNSDVRLVKIFVTVKCLDIKNIKLSELEQQINIATCSWYDDLKILLKKEYGRTKADDLVKIYDDAFTSDYRDKFSPEETINNITHIEKSISSNDVVFNIEQGENGIINLKLFAHDQLILSDIIPMLWKVGFATISSDAYKIRHVKGDLWFHCFHMKTLEQNNQKIENDVLIESLLAIWHEKLPSDMFNKLIIAVGINWREIFLLRCYAKYLKQTNFKLSEEYIAHVLSKYPEITKKLVELFQLKFDPVLSKDYNKKFAKIEREFKDSLNDVTVVTEDKVLRSYFALTMSMLRTNYYQKDNNGNYYDYISFKFSSKLIPNLPLPYPFAEIFVYSTDVEAIHLRGGKVARGGLRWSDRFDDYRTEVLGLMKAQMAKNSVIVPVGSKGGFIVKKPKIGESREVQNAHVVNCYKTFLRGILSITDNIIEHKVVNPVNVVRYDEDDPYLVVAADKGTATFSDYANSVSKEFNFWLGDAFASGGSVGYDHKKMAITARGAWISVKRHFAEMGKNIDHETFSAVGIGDMAGDVFGNGMLLSDNMHLYAAFNHMHIFIDPNPDAKKSFAERKRLFELPRSSWQDYDNEALSEGSMIYERSAKILHLTPQIRQRFLISEESITPDELIQVILRADVDLLWNGGIGTYVKSTLESHEQVGDKSNDTLRINGCELRCKIVGEGGNLGFTQLGRIEFARNGGRINTDAIDNSAGVDCSDHEVNMKIVLNQIMVSGRLEEQKRNKLLEQMTDDVASLVLADNYNQNQILSLEQLNATLYLEDHARVIELLEREKLLNRSIEFLPNKQEITRRISVSEGLSRPELAVLLSYSKISLFNKVIESNVSKDKFCNKYLIEYFPEKMQELFSDDIISHPLRNEIIITVLINDMINRTGICFAHFAIEDTGLKGCDIIRAYIVANEIFGLGKIWKELEALDGKIDAKEQLKMMYQLQKLTKYLVFWFLRHAKQPLQVPVLIRDYHDLVNKYMHNINCMSESQEHQEIFDVMKHYVDMGVSKDLAFKIAVLPKIYSACAIAKIAKISKKDIESVAHIYHNVAKRFAFDWFYSAMRRVVSNNYWERLSLHTLHEQLDDLNMLITKQVLIHANDDNPMEMWIKDNGKQVVRCDNFINEFKSQDYITLAMMVVAITRIQALFVAGE
jgi:glutamate dehydrogenase